jgi:hypothetical protein
MENRSNEIVSLNGFSCYKRGAEDIYLSKWIGISFKAELYTPAIPVGEGHHAMGWFVATADGMQVLNHNGDTSRFHSYLVLIPELGLGSAGA